MTLLQLFLEHGDPHQTYHDKVVAAFLTNVDDGSLLLEALGEMSDHDRTKIAELVDDYHSRSLSHQIIGKIVVDQLLRYVRRYLQKKHDDMRDEIEAAKAERDLDAVSERRVDEARLEDDGEQKGWHA